MDTDTIHAAREAVTRAARRALLHAARLEADELAGPVSAPHFRQGASRALARLWSHDHGAAHRVELRAADEAAEARGCTLTPEDYETLRLLDRAHDLEQTVWAVVRLRSACGASWTVVSAGPAATLAEAHKPPSCSVLSVHATEEAAQAAEFGSVYR